MSKRNGAKAVTQYRDEGDPPMRRRTIWRAWGWSHGDDGILARTVPGVVRSDHLGRSAASSTKPSCAG